MRFTPRQLQIIDMVVEGVTRKQIATRLGISPNTVRQHLYIIGQRIPGSGRPAIRIVRWRLTQQS